MSLIFSLILSQLTCPNGVCRPNPIAWRTRADDPGRAYLFVEGQQRGGYDRARDEWRDFDPIAQTWGEPRRLFPERDAPNFGVMRDRLANSERFSLGGVPVERTEAFSALSALPDDSKLPHLTIIGNADDRRAVATISPSPALPCAINFLCKVTSLITGPSRTSASSTPASRQSTCNLPMAACCRQERKSRLTTCRVFARPELNRARRRS